MSPFLFTVIVSSMLVTLSILAVFLTVKYLRKKTIASESDSNSKSISIQKTQLDAIDILVKSLHQVDSGIIHIGNLLLVKTKDAYKGNIIIRVLDDTEVLMVAENPAFLRDPDAVIDLLNRKAPREEILTTGNHDNA